jgi:hypothetical protein
MDYKKIYNSICQKGKDRLEERKQLKKEGIYFEGHHIVPQSMGGGGLASNWDHENITPLTAREHFLAHKILCIVHPDDNKLSFALWGMCNQKKGKVSRSYIVTSRDYEDARKLFIKHFSGENHPNFGGNNILKGEDHPLFGKVTSGAFKKGEDHLLYGKPGYWSSIPKEDHPLMKNPFRAYGKNHPRAKKVVQIDKNTLEKLNFFDTVVQAGKESGVDRRLISANLVGKQKTAGGYIWEYMN